MRKSWMRCFPTILLGITSFTMNAESNTPNLQEEKGTDGVVMKVLNKIDNRVSNHVNFSGYILGRALYSSQPDNHGGFDIRMLRLILNGNISKDFAYRIQLEMAGDPRILDAWAEWKKYDFFRIRAGQMKRCFTFENPWSPVTLGVSEYSQVIMKLSGFTDRVGEHTCGGRDVGIMLSGDFVHTSTHPLFRYEVGVYNGNGINRADNNKSKDLIGSLYVRPQKNLWLGGGYWLGEYGPKDKKVDRKRWTVGFKYDDNRYLLRGEYIASKGKKMDQPDSKNIADGWYITGGMPVAKNLKAFLKYDVYRDNKTYDSQSTRYMAALNWSVHKYIILQATYFYTDDKKPGSHNSNNAVAQMFVRF